MAKQKEKESGSLAGALLAGGLSFLLGVALAFASLASKSAEVRSDPPEEEDRQPGVVYYVPGEQSYNRTYRAKLAQLEQTGAVEVTFTEAELNRWSDLRLLPPEAAPEEEKQEGWFSYLRMETTPLNVRLPGEEIQLATELSLPNLFPGKTFVYQMRGHLDDGPSGPRFRPHWGRLGSVPTGFLPGLGALLSSRVRTLLSESEGAGRFAEVWPRVETVALGEERLTLRLRASE